MATIKSPYKPPTPGNSLGRARGPCHNCSESNLECDGQRPRCFVCMKNQLSCRGYKLELSWQSGVATRGNLKGFKYPPAPVQLSSATAPKPLTETVVSKGKKSKAGSFKFVTGRPAKRRKDREQVGMHQFDSNVAPESTPDLAVDIDSGGISPIEFEISQSPQQSSVSYSQAMKSNYANSSPMQGLSPTSSYSLPLQGNEDVSTYIFSTPFIEAQSPASGYESDSQSSQVSFDSSLESIGKDDETIIQNYNSFKPVLCSPVLFATLTDKFHGILAQYDQDICVIPITSDCNLNPFRIRKESSSGSQFLLHAILATSFYHLTRNSQETSDLDLMERHRSTALHLFSKALVEQSTSSNGVSFLDTALLLMYLDSASSANGMFNVHLEGVRSIIDMAGGAEFLIPKMPKLRAQLAMFIWCDTTIAIISRDLPTLPVSYLGAILRHGKGDGWDYFHLSGCREEFVIAMVKLAKLAMQNEKAEELEWLTFDTSGVDEVEEALQECSAIPPLHDETEDQETLERAKDRYHCEEAWRTGLLLYIARVFRWKRTDPAPGKIRYLARVVLDHARSIRRSSATQKQLLLPVFLAAAEMQSEDYRDFARDYCKWWTKSCGFKMFTDVSCYLEDIWEELDNPTEPHIWWATIIDRRKRESQQPRLPQILMG